MLLRSCRTSPAWCLFLQRVRLFVMSLQVKHQRHWESRWTLALHSCQRRFESLCNLNHSWSCTMHVDSYIFNGCQLHGCAFSSQFIGRTFLIKLLDNIMKHWKDLFPILPPNCPSERWALHSYGWKQGLILLSAVWQCDYENQLWGLFRSRMQPPLEESLMVNMCSDCSAARKQFKAELKKLFSASSVTIIYRLHWTSHCFMNPDPHHMSRLVTLNSFSFFGSLSHMKYRHISGWWGFKSTQTNDATPVVFLYQLTTFSGCRYSSSFAASLPSAGRHEFTEGFVKLQSQCFTSLNELLTRFRLRPV